MLTLVIAISAAGVYAEWMFSYAPEPVSENMNISINEFSYEPPKTLYITGVEVVSQSSSITNLSYKYTFPTDFEFSLRNAQSTNQITYKISVFNNSDVTYWYINTLFDEAYGSNDLIGNSSGIVMTLKDKLGDNNATFNFNDYVPAHTARDFYVTYTFGQNAMWDLSTKVNFKFDIRMDSVYDGFLAILNDPVKYEFLSEAFNDNYSEDGSTVIGNIGEDKFIFDTLFGEDLTINVDGVTTPVTVMIERSNVDGRTTGDSYSPDGPSGCEYTVYVTVHNTAGEATVHAISYSCKSDGVWYQIGQLYEGTATVNSDGSVDVDSWEAVAKEYVIGGAETNTNEIKYKVGYEQGTTYDKYKTIEDIMSADDQEVFNKIDNSRIFKRAYDILKENEGSDAPEVVLLRNAFEAASPYYYNFNNGQEFKVNRNYTRSELIPYILAIDDAINYYNQVHG